MTPTSSTRATLTPAVPSASVAIAAFLLGFGALNVFALSGTGAADLSGLYTFRSATVGDALLLPILAYGLVRSAAIQAEWTRTERRLIAIGAAIGVLAGSTQVVIWLLDPDPRLNWTFPAPGAFNLPGWYHAAFLVTASGFFAAAGVAVVLRLRSCVHQGLPMTPRLRSLSTLAVLAPGPTFLGLLLLDNDAPLATIAIYVCAASSALILIAWWACGFPSFRWIVLLWIAVMGIALVFCGLFVPRPAAEPSFVLAVATAAFGGAFATASFRAPSIGARLGLAALLAVCCAGAVHGALATVAPPLPAATLGMGTFAVIVTALVLTLRALVSSLRPPVAETLRDLVAVQPLVAFALAGVYYARMEGNRDSAAVVGLAATALFLAVTARAVRMRFDVVIKTETQGLSPYLSHAKWAAYSAICSAYGAAMSAFLAFTLGVYSNERWVAGEPVDASHLIYPATILAAVLLVLALCAGIRRVLGTHAALVVVVCASGLLWCTFMTVQLTDGFQSTTQRALAVFVSILAGLFAVEGVVANTTCLHNVRVTWPVASVGAVSGLVVALSTAWAIGPGIASRSGAWQIWTALAGLGIAALACGLAPWFAAMTLPGAKPARQYAIASPLAGVLQDTFICTLLWITLGWMPILLLVHVTAGTLLWVGPASFYLAMLGAAYVYVMRNNVEHLERDRTRLTDAAGPGGIVPADEWRAHAALAGHIRRQNMLAFVIIIPMGLFILFQEISGFDRRGVTDLLR
jgi:hypothetical protein